VGRRLTCLLLLALVGCGTEIGIGEAPSVDRSPLVLETTVIDAAAGAARFLEGEQVLVETPDGYRLWTPADGAGPLWEGPLGLRDAASAVGRTWLASSEGLYVLDDGAFVASPLGDAMGGEVHRMELSVDGLWLGGTGGLHWYRDDQLVGPADDILAQASGAVAYGLMPDQNPGIWFVSRSGLHGVRAEAGALARFRLPVEGATDLAADGAGTLWWTDVEGALFSRTADGRTWEAPLQAAVGKLAASPAAPGVWVDTEDGLSFVEPGAVRPVEGPSGAVRLLDAGPGLALVLDGRGLVLVGATTSHPDPGPGPQSPTWSEDVRPLAEASCFLCHGANGSARDLSTREAWSTQWSDIEQNVRSARMPLPPLDPLDPEQLQLLEAWADAGFPE